MESYGTTKSSFFSLVARGKLLTSEDRTRRGMSNYPFCERYGLCIESVIHVVRDCGFAQAVWKLVVKWIIWNIRNVGKFNFLRGKWGSFYLIVCWLLWKNRNDFIFNHASGNSYDFISSTVN